VLITHDLRMIFLNTSILDIKIAFGYLFQDFLENVRFLLHKKKIHKSLSNKDTL